MYARRNAHESEVTPDRNRARLVRYRCGRPMGGDRPRQPCPKHHQHVGQHRPHLQDRREYGRELCRDGENLRAGEEVLRPAQGGEQPDTGRPQGARHHPDGGRRVGHLRDQLREDDERREFLAPRAGRHRLRLRPAAGGEQRRVAGPQAGHQREHALHDRQGPYGRGGPLLLRDAPLPQPGELLYEQEHRRELSQGQEEERPGARDAALRG